MTRDEIHTLLMQGLGLKKEPVALKPLREIPADIPAYEGLATPGLCAQINEILTQGSVFYSTKKNHVCFEGLIATGVCDVDREEYREAVAEFIDLCPYHKDMQTAMDFYETCIREIPVPPMKHVCLLSGPLSKIEDPDLVVIFCTPRQADILVRSQSYQGTLVRGFGGNGGCIFNIRHAFITREMTFSTSDFPWRTFVGLDDCELTVTFPYEKLQASAQYIQPIIDYVDSLKQVFGVQ
jgi:uncharacterized protein (DUF169 family)